MKKIILILFVIFSVQGVRACDYKIEKIDWTATTSTKLNIRTSPCVGTQIHWKTPANVSYKLLWKANDYYQVEINWQKVFIREKWTKIDKNYFPSYNEQILVWKVIEISSEYTDEKKKYWVNKLDLALLKLVKNSRKYVLIKMIRDGIKNTIIPQKEKENVEITDLSYYWLELYNNYRKKMWLTKYQYSKKLEKTAQERAETLANRWSYSHKRDLWDSYYDYNKIVRRFGERWVNCEVRWWLSILENIGYWMYHCPSWNCPTKLKSVVKQTFDNYLQEKWKKYRPHYNSIVHKSVKYLWFGVIQKNVWNGMYKVYNVTHFCTEFK